MMKKLQRKRVLLILFIGMLVLLFVYSDWMGRWVYPIHYREDIKLSAANYEVDPYLVAAIIRSETNYKTGRESAKGALGIMQIMPDTANWIVERASFTNVTLEDVHHRADVAIEMGTWYISYLQKQFEGRSMEVVIAAYNAGQGNVRRWLNEGNWDGQANTVSQIPFGETRHYVQRVIYYYNKYKDLHGTL